MIAAVLLPLRGADCCKDTVAVVASLSPPATTHRPGGIATPLSSFDWLSRDSIIELGGGASATLIFQNGHRYELRGVAKATIKADGLAQVSGAVQDLSPLQPMPKFVPLPGGETASLAVRFRGSNEIHNLYPHAGNSALPSRVKLQFSAVPGARTYDISLDEDGDIILSLRDPSTSVNVPSDLLKAGAHYSWSVRAIGDSGVLAEAAAEFTTISQAGLQERAVFADALKGMDDASRLALMGAVDFRLGLIAEAGEEFEAAQRLKRGDPALQRWADLARTALTESVK
jgi:hypothetical protein